MALDPSRLALTSVLLGEGSFGRVVAGTLTVGGNGSRLPLAVAAKMLPALTREDERRAFDRELRAHMHAAQNCDGVCVLHGTCEKQQRMCIVMKKYERSLFDVIVAASGSLDAGVVRRYGHSLFRTLRQLHEMRPALVVQDIKPQNILVDAHDELVLSDFGISEVVRTQTRIMPSSVKGTFNYMSPEAFEPEAAGGIGPPADVWSMGCVLIEIYTGEIFYDAEEYIEHLAMIEK
jgi:serine/threonine protein kinase